MEEVRKGYKMTDIGVIPEDWEVKEFKKIFTMLPNNSLSRDNLNYSKGDYVDIHYGDVLIKYGHVLDAQMSNLPYINQSVSKKWRNINIVSDGDVIMADTAEDNTVGKSSEIQNVGQLKVVSGLHTFWLHPISGLFAKRFLGYYINSSLYHNQLLPFIHGTKVSSISKNEIVLTLITVPSIQEQTAIATALSDMDSLISALGKKIEKKKAIKQGLMQQLLSGEKRLPEFCTNNKFNEGYPIDWKVVNLKKLCTLNARIGWQGLTKNEYLKSGHYMLVTGTDFNDGKINWNSCVFVSKDRYEQDLKIQLKTNDILITKDGTIGKVAFVEEMPCPASLNSGVFVVRSKNEEKLDQRYLSMIFSSFIFDDFLNALVAGSTINHLYQKDFVGFNFPIPPTLAEQTAIANILSDCDKEISSLEAKRDKYKELKLGMMQQLLTGNIRLI